MADLGELLLVGGTVASGLIGGLFFAYANSVMPALRGADDHAFVDVMQRVNEVILNPLFLTPFLGAVVVDAAAAAAVWSGDDRAALPWAMAGTGLYAATLAITMRFNVPMNLRLAAPGALTDAHTTRSAFERRWTTWNLARAVTSVAAFACMAVAAAVHQ